MDVLPRPREPGFNLEDELLREFEDHGAFDIDVELASPLKDIYDPGTAAPLPDDLRELAQIVGYEPAPEPAPDKAAAADWDDVLVELALPLEDAATRRILAPMVLGDIRRGRHAVPGAVDLMMVELDPGFRPYP